MQSHSSTENPLPWSTICHGRDELCSAVAAKPLPARGMTTGPCAQAAVLLTGKLCMPSLSSHPCPGCTCTSYISLLVSWQRTVLPHAIPAPVLLSSTSLCPGPGLCVGRWLMMSSCIAHDLLRCQAGQREAACSTRYGKGALCRLVIKLSVLIFLPLVKLGKYFWDRQLLVWL